MNKYNKTIIDNSTLYLGDCLEVMKIIPDKSIDMILCDLPYGTTACKWDVIIPFEPLWEQYKRIIKDKGCIALFGSEPFSSYLRMSNIKEYKYDWIWDKTTAKGHLTAKIRPMQQTELISVFGNGSIKYFPIMKDRPKNKIEIGRECRRTEIMGGISHNYSKIYTQWYPKTLLPFKVETGIHPTQKPVALLEYLIKTYTLENETILDNCMGSGSTKVACMNTNRKFIGIEKDEKYFEIAKNRKPGDKKVVEKKNNNSLFD
jgi:site-specific DNA-methyltransferase (adenine-specific)